MSEPVDPAGLFTPPKGVRVTPAPYREVVLHDTGYDLNRIHRIAIQCVAERLGVPVRTIGESEARRQFGEHARSHDALLVVHYPGTQRKQKLIPLASQYAEETIREEVYD